MIEGLTAYAARMWSAWFDAPAPDLRLALGSGGPAHQTRAAVFLFPDRSWRPAVVMKIAFSELEAGFLHHEFASLSEIRPLLPTDVRSTIPEALGLEEVAGATVLSLGALEGRRLLVPHLTSGGELVSRRLMQSFFRRAFSWSERITRATGHGDERSEEALVELVERFRQVTSPPPPVAKRLDGFGRALSRLRLRWRPTWQHGDLAVGNVLVHRGRLRCIDWEHASRDGEPWFDVAQAPGATARLAQRQSGFDSATAAAMAVLPESAWVGAILSRELQEAWRHEIPMGWAVTLTSMATAIRQQEERRVGAADWADLAGALVADREVREKLSWLAPEW